MDRAGNYLVVWLSPEAIETFLGVLEPAQEHAMTTWTVAGQIVGEAGPACPEEPVYFLRWELVTTARLYDAMPTLSRVSASRWGSGLRPPTRTWGHPMPSPSSCSSRSPRGGLARAPEFTEGWR
jgi:hypothetical protein